MDVKRINTNSYKTIIKDNNPLFLEIDSITKLDIIVNENVSSRLVIIGNSDYDINIILLNNATLVINSINKNNSVNATVSLNELANITYNHSIFSVNESINTFTINHLANSSVSILNNNGINNGNNKLFFTIDGIIPNKLHNITCNQSSKIINYKNGDSKIIPNLIISSNDIIANHAAYIGEINEEELFYMQSRGIDKENIKKLVYKGVLLGSMELKEEKEEFNKIINEWW